MSAERIAIIREFPEAFSESGSRAFCPTNSKRLESMRIRGAFVMQAHI